MKLSSLIRDFVFGMEDGLVSNLGLVLGVYVGGGSSYAIILAGLASMFAGAFSMSAGSYLSAKSQREVYEQEISSTKRRLKKHPKESLEEMKDILKMEGFSQREIKVMCNHFSRHNESTFTRNYIQKKLGLSEARFELPLKNAFMMFVSFLVGSIFPIAPFIFSGKDTAVWIAPILAIILLFIVGWVKSVYTNRNWLKSGLEIVLVGVGAGVIGYLVGLLLRMI
jgi:vacuolar iron transporter family protein